MNTHSEPRKSPAYDKEVGTQKIIDDLGDLYNMFSDIQQKLSILNTSIQNMELKLSNYRDTIQNKGVETPE